MVGLSALDLCLQEAQGFLTTGIGSTPRSSPFLLGRGARDAEGLGPARPGCGKLPKG